jgi:hypothetical protein
LFYILLSLTILIYLQAVSPRSDKLPRRAASFMPSTKERPVHLVHNTGTLPRPRASISVSQPSKSKPQSPPSEEKHQH